jgi:hypothetical protein
MILTGGNSKASTPTEVLGQGVLVVVLAGAIAFAIGFGAWFGVFAVEFMIAQ